MYSDKHTRTGQTCSPELGRTERSKNSLKVLDLSRSRVKKPHILLHDQNLIDIVDVDARDRLTGWDGNSLYHSAPSQWQYIKAYHIARARVQKTSVMESYSQWPSKDALRRCYLLRLIEALKCIHDKAHNVQVSATDTHVECDVIHKIIHLALLIE
jgi:hypothetical protein